MYTPGRGMRTPGGSIGIGNVYIVAIEINRRYAYACTCLIASLTPDFAAPNLTYSVNCCMYYNTDLDLVLMEGI